MPHIKLMHTNKTKTSKRISGFTLMLHPGAHLVISSIVQCPPASCSNVSLPSSKARELKHISKKKKRKYIEIVVITMTVSDFKKQWQWVKVKYLTHYRITLERTPSPEHGASNKTLLLLSGSPSWKINEQLIRNKWFQSSILHKNGTTYS